jgi:hypothetical protein
MEIKVKREIYAERISYDTYTKIKKYEACL